MSRVDREAVAAELLELLDQVEAEEEAARESAKKHKDRLLQLKGQAKEWRDILAGKRGVQMPLMAGVLKAAGEVAERKKTSPLMCACGVMVDEPNPNCDHHRERERAAKPKKTRTKGDGERRGKGQMTVAEAAQYARDYRANAPWLATLIEQPGAPRFSWPQWWPSLNAAGKPSHGPNGAKCPDTGRDWRDCATCAAEVSRPKGGEP